jgi:phenylpyruvate tautomerase PptA (4-oxalocrotonate tautomerase family)
MPFVRISMFPRPKEVKEALAKELTHVISKHCKITDDHTWIVFEDVEREKWSQGGKLQG